MTVEELIAAVERVVGKPVPVTEGPPRPGDVVGAFANADKAADLLGRRTEASYEAIASALAGGEKRSLSSATSETPLVEVRRVQQEPSNKDTVRWLPGSQRAASHLDPRCGKGAAAEDDDAKGAPEDVQALEHRPVAT